MKYLSLFSGVEAASLAWEGLGWEPVAFSQYDPDNNYARGQDFSSEVLAQRWPDVINLGDVTAITEKQIKSLGRIDLIVFGSPCQGLSIAGKQEGLEDERSGLFRDAIKIIKLCRKYCSTRFSLWENVPGAFSSNRGSDFAEVLKLLSGSEFQSDKWQTSGVAIGKQGLTEWVTLDAQYFGVPQRRRRVFALTDFGDWQNRGEILFESESLPRDIKTSREAKENTTAKASNGIRTPSHWDSEIAPHPTLNQSHNTGGIAQSNQELFSQRGAGLVSTPQMFNESSFGGWKEGVGPVRASGGYVGGGSENIRIPIHDKATRYSGKTGIGSGNGLGIGKDGEPCPTLTAGDKHVIACFDMQAFGKYGDGKTASTKKARDHKDATDLVVNKNMVRKLTPIECERLQGMPDNHTRIIWRGKPEEECPDGPRYKAIGNSMAVPVMKWIAQRIDSVINA